MTLIFNLLLPTVLLLIGVITYYAAKGKKRWEITAMKGCAVGLFVSIVHMNMLPSYLPKGEAPAMSRVPIETTEAVIQDRLLKPKTEEERQERVDELLTVTQEVKDILKDKN